MKLDGDSALITGASAGLGCEFARQLAGRMRSLILLARREQQLNELRDELTQQHPNLVVHVRRTDLAEALQAEVLGTGVTVCALCPGPVRTELQEVAKRSEGPVENAPEFAVVTVEQVVRDALRALESNRPLIIPGLKMKLSMLLVRMTPMPILRWASRFSAKRT